MRIFIILGIILLTALSFANAQSTLSSVNVNGQNYDITYRTNVNFNDYQTTIDDAPWWDGGTPSASVFANALYDYNSNTSAIRFAFKEYPELIGTTDYVNYYSYDDQTAIGSSETNAAYAISAVAVPAPLPILGILPVVGFLKRMRKRQRA